LFAVVFGKKTQTVAKELHGFRALVAPGGCDEIRQRRHRRDLQCRNTFGWNREVNALSAGDLKRSDADDLSLHVHDGTAARSGRDRRGDLNDAAEGGNVAHGGNYSV